MLLLESDGSGSVVVPEYATQEMQRRLSSVSPDKVIVLVQKLRQTTNPTDDGTPRTSQVVRPRAMAS
jgi:hypothetical protein